VLRPALLVLLAVGVYPAYRLAAELRPALAGVYTRGELRAAGWVVVAGSFVAPAALALVGGTVAAVAAAGVLLAAAFAVRRVVVYLPHRITGHGAPTR
jgi:hypothetical protein